MTQDLEGLVRRPKQYWFEDGVAELATGAMLLAVGLLFAVESSAPAGSALSKVSVVGVPLLALLGFVAVRRLIRAAKERITYPRSGYVQFRKPPRQERWLTGSLGAVLAVALVVLVRSAPASLRWIPVVNGLVISMFLAFIGYRVGMPRFHVLAGLSLVAGALAGLRFSDDKAGSAAYFLMVGMALGLSGALALRRYLSATRRTALSVEEPRG